MKQQKGFGLVGIIVIVTALIIASIVGWVIWANANKPQPESARQSQTSTDQNQKSSLQIAQINTQVKNDATRVATGVVEYTSNNMGQYPTSEQAINDVMQHYILATGSFDSPITNKTYSLVLTDAYAQGTINLQKGQCSSNGVEPAQSSRQYAVVTLLYDRSVYCTDL